MAKVTATVVFKNGKKFSFECDEVTTQTNNYDGSLLAMNWKGANEKRPLHIDINEVIAVWIKDKQLKE
ncbi:hypothetical protein JNUCC1_03328 [Lentibacillus sp. JNUCC-1]|uniref:hypothetical protein n=1 Tax=Lentibacillus sp. JNUCC-1 TaxID=2654513 RepID=UPI0012E71F6E|nr:hypothetical protein [Lentibacillus sp. JNUCC-1]MUV39450.1 hypothetical protein [Lentibacillus sp. JNUCC-1]